MGVGTAGISTELHFAADLGTTFVDTSQAEQVLMNLLVTPRAPDALASAGDE